MDNAHIHDKAYKYLLSNPLILKELLECFVRMEWVGKVDFKKVETLDKSFVSDAFKEKESDIIYKLKLKGQDVYLYLLIEFQSTVDRFISLRMLRYVLEFYEHLIKNRKAKRLPVVFPLMLYNGDRSWDAPEDVSQLIETPKGLGAIKSYLPQFKYFKIVENEFSEKSLRQFHNIVSTIFLIENKDKKKLGELHEIIDQLDKLLKYENPSAARTFLVWLENFLRENADIETIDRTTQKIRNLKEVKSMLALKIERWEKEIKTEGIAEGEERLVKNMHAKNLSVEQISLYTGIPADKVERIIQKT